MWVNCLHSIYIVLGIKSNREMIQSIWAEVCTLHANITPFYKRDLSIHEFGISSQSPIDTEGELYANHQDREYSRNSKWLWGRDDKNSILDKVRSLKDIKVDFQ